MSIIYIPENQGGPKKHRPHEAGERKEDRKKTRVWNRSSDVIEERTEKKEEKAGVITSAWKKASRVTKEAEKAKVEVSRHEGSPAPKRRDQRMTR